MYCVKENLAARSLRFMGFPDAANAPAWAKKLVSEKMPVAENLAVPVSFSSFLSTDECSEEIAGVLGHRHNFEVVALILITLGKGPEAQVSRLLLKGLTRDALALDAISTSILMNLSERYLDKLSEKAGESQLSPCARLEPGQAGVPLSMQGYILEHLPEASKYVSLSDDLMLKPVKSLSSIILLSKSGEGINDLHSCSDCTMKNCQFRRL